MLALRIISRISLSVALSCALAILLHELRHPQKMRIMNIVWPVTALYFSLGAVWAYFRFGHSQPRRDASPQENDPPDPPEVPRGGLKWSQIALATSHCGAGCTLADIVTENAVFVYGLTLFGVPIFASYLWDLAAAWLLGIVFQYFTIKPLRNLTFSEGVVAAIKADTLSIIAFQVGMYGWMALAYFVFFPEFHLRPDQSAFWFMMQIAMIAGFATSYPMNRWLIKSGLKEPMG